MSAVSRIQSRVAGTSLKKERKKENPKVHLTVCCYNQSTWAKIYEEFVLTICQCQYLGYFVQQRSQFHHHTPSPHAGCSPLPTTLPSTVHEEISICTLSWWNPKPPWFCGHSVLHSHYCCGKYMYNTSELQNSISTEYTLHEVPELPWYFSSGEYEVEF